MKLARLVHKKNDSYNFVWKAIVFTQAGIGNCFGNVETIGGKGMELG
jgi:hypothetical protein